MVDARRAALEAADDDQVRHRRMRFAAATPGALAIGGVALAGTGAHRLVGGIGRQQRGQGVRVGVRQSVASLAVMPVPLVQPPLGDLGSSLQHFFNATTEFFRHLSEVHWDQFGLALLCLLAMQLARAWAWRNVLRAAYPEKRISFTAARRRLPRRGGDQRHHPGPCGRRDEGLPGQTPDPRLLLSGGHLLVPRADHLRHLGRHPGAPLRDHPGTPAAAAGDPPPARLRGLLLGEPPEDAGDHGRRPDPRDRRRHLVPRPARTPLLGPGETGPDHPLPARGLHEAGLRLAGSRLALPLRRLLVLPRGLRPERVDRQRDAGDERPGDREHRPLHPGRRRRSAGAPRRHPPRPLARRRPLLLGRHPDRDGRLVGPARLRRHLPRLPHHRLARPDPPGPGGRRPRGRRESHGAPDTPPEHRQSDQPG